MNNTLDFEGGNGDVPAHQHVNSHDLAADTGIVDYTAFIGIGEFLITLILMIIRPDMW